MAVPIIPRVIRGRLHFQIADVLFSTFAQAASAASAAESHRLDLLDTLTEQRSAALAAMRASARDLKAFAAAAKVEADLAFQIRRLKRNGATVKEVRHA